MNDEAIFEYKRFDSYFQDNNREAYFIKPREVLWTLEKFAEIKK